MNRFGIVFITVGTTEFDELIKKVDTEAFIEIIHACKCEELVIQIGRGKYEPKKLIYLCRIRNIVLKIFRFKDTLKDDMVRSDLIISHCGAGSILEIVGMQRLLIIVINPTLQENHQIELANALNNKYNCISSEPDTLLTALDQMTKITKQIETKSMFPILFPNFFSRKVDEMFDFK